VLCGVCSEDRAKNRPSRKKCSTDQYAKLLSKVMYALDKVQGSNDVALKGLGDCAECVVRINLPQLV
jgi:hypothetical protein